MHGLFSLAQGRSGWLTREERPWAFAFAGLLAFILIVNPVGYMGGNWDDWQYLNAARCWVEYGPCLPSDHWQGRWPVVAPLAASIALFGGSRLAVGLPFLFVFLGLALMIVRLGNLLAVRPIGWMVATFYLAIPFVATQLLQPSVEAIELMFLVASALLLVHFAARRKASLLLGAALCFALAVQTRETAALAAPLLLAAGWKLRATRREWAIALLGTALPFLVELAIMATSSGDPFYRRSLSLAHGSIASRELAGGSVEGSPLFNLALIEGWRHKPGLTLHWAIDGLLNLPFNGNGGVSILLNLLLLPIAWRLLDHDRRCLAAMAAGVGFYWACALIYGLSIDPKARMMAVPLLCSTMILCLQLEGLWKDGRRLLAGVVTGAVLGLGMAGITVQQQLGRVEPKIADLLVNQREAIETDTVTRQHLALVPGIEKVRDLGSGQPLLLVKVDDECAKWVSAHLQREVRVEAGWRLTRHSRPVSLCLLRYSEIVPPYRLNDALNPPPDDYDPMKGFEIVREKLGLGKNATTPASSMR